MLHGETVDPVFTGGIYLNGETDLDQTSFHAGYMFKNQIEIVGGYQSQDASNYEKKWGRTSIGVNYFVNRYKMKGQVTYQRGENVFGVAGVDTTTLFLQAQFVL